MTSPASAPPLDYARLLSGLLDTNYTNAVRPVVNAITNQISSGLIAQRLTELDAEAARLAQANQPLRPDNPVFRALLADLEPVLKRQASLIDAVSPELQQQGVNAGRVWFEQTTVPGVSPQRLGQLGINFNVPDPAALGELVNYTESEAFQQSLSKYPPYVLETIQNQAINGFVNGQNPNKTARQIADMTQGLPLSQANNMMRTLQLQSYRNSNAAHQLANSDIIEAQVRIAALDDRTCLCCIALHGTVMKPGEVVRDHHSGRCTSVALLKGRPFSIQTGEEWFDGLPPTTQRAIAGKGAYEALQSGQVRLKDFVSPYKDKVYGDMLRQGSLKDVLAKADNRSFKGSSFTSADELAANKVTYPTYTSEARLLRAADLEDADPANPVVAAKAQMVAYDTVGNPKFDKALIQEVHSNLLYDIYRIGRDNPRQDDLINARVQAAAIISAYQEAGIKITRAQMNQLMRLSEGDVEAEIDKIKDNRAVGRAGGSGGVRNKFMSASGAEGAQRFFEERMKGFVAGVDDRGLEMNFDILGHD